MKNYGIKTIPNDMMLWSKTLILLAGILWTGVFCPAVSHSGDLRRADLPKEARVSEKIFGLPGLTNVGRVAPGIFRGAQPTAEGFRTLKSMGIRTVINLRNKHSERKAVEESGMKSIEIPFDIFSTPEASRVDKVISLMSDERNHPVFLHCAHGQDRTGTIVAIYRMKINEWSLSMAEEEMQAFGFNDIWVHLKSYVRQYPNANK